MDDTQTTVEEIYNAITANLHKYVKKNGLKDSVVGLSGGIDSAVTLKLAVDALGPENVFAILMPETGLTSTENIAHAKTLCEFFKIQYYSQPINSFLVDYAQLPWKQNDLAYMNTKARIRATILYNFANTFQALVLGTSNKSELMLGYGTKYGDLASDIMVIGDLYKTEVYKLAEFMGLPKELINKPPSAELFDGQTDEEDLGGTYKEIDTILMQIDLGEAALLEKGMNALLVRKIFQRSETNKHKLSMPPVIPAH